jgi:hypothetical protein
VPSRAGIALGDAEYFGVLAGSTITSTGATQVRGFMGVSPGTAITSTAGPMMVNGAVFSYKNPAIFRGATSLPAKNAKAAVLIAYNTAAGAVLEDTPTKVWGPVHIIGTGTLPPGVYNAPSSLAITTSLTLDAGAKGDKAVWIFQCGSTLVVTGKVYLTGGALARNVFWQVGSSATLMGGSHTVGTVMAMASITSAATGASVDGRLFAITAAVTFTGVGNVGLDEWENNLPPPPCDTVANPNCASCTVASDCVTGVLVCVCHE